MRGQSIYKDQLWFKAIKELFVNRNDKDIGRVLNHYAIDAKAGDATEVLPSDITAHINSFTTEVFVEDQNIISNILLWYSRLIPMLKKVYTELFSERVVQTACYKEISNARTLDQKNRDSECKQAEIDLKLVYFDFGSTLNQIISILVRHKINAHFKYSPDYPSITGEVILSIINTLTVFFSEECRNNQVCRAYLSSFILKERAKSDNFFLFDIFSVLVAQYSERKLINGFISLQNICDQFYNKFIQSFLYAFANALQNNPSYSLDSLYCELCGFADQVSIDSIADYIDFDSIVREHVVRNNEIPLLRVSSFFRKLNENERVMKDFGFQFLEAVNKRLEHLPSQYRERLLDLMSALDRHCQVFDDVFLKMLQVRLKCESYLLTHAFGCRDIISYNKRITQRGLFVPRDPDVSMAFNTLAILARFPDQHVEEARLKLGLKIIGLKIQASSVRGDLSTSLATLLACKPQSGMLEQKGCIKLR